MNAVKIATVLTHRRPSETAPAIAALLEIACEMGAVMRLDPEETRKHRLEPADGLVLDAPIESDVDICFALGGDGTILGALRTYAGTNVPVFAVNFGEIGFLATVDREQAQSGFRAGVCRRFRCTSPAGDLDCRETRSLDGDQRHFDAPAARQAGRGPRVCGRRR